MSSFSVIPVSHRFGRDHWDSWPNRAFYDDEPFMRMEESMLTNASYPRYYMVPNRTPANIGASLGSSNRPLLGRQLSAIAPELRSDGNNFNILLDVAQFTPDEIEVRVAESTVTVTGKHEEKDKNGICSREFTRRYTLPEDVDPKAVSSTLSADGVLTLKAPRKLALKDEERVVPLKVTHVNTKQ